MNSAAFVAWVAATVLMGALANIAYLDGRMGSAAVMGVLTCISTAATCFVGALQ